MTTTASDLLERPHELTPRSGRRLPTRRNPGPGASGRKHDGLSGAPDAAVGVVFGLLGGSNLVQGAWTEELPWLDLTTFAFALAIPICLGGLRRKISLPAIVSFLLLSAALALGYLAPALTANAQLKRTNLLLGVAFVFVASYLSLSNPRRIKAFLATIVCLALPLLVLQVIQPDALALSTGRRTPVGLNAIGTGRAIAAALVIVLALVVHPSHRRRRPLAAPLLVLLATGLFLSGSRGPTVAALAAVLVLIWKHPSTSRGTKLALVVGLGLAGTVFYRFASTTSRLVELTTSGREVIYSSAVRVATDNPLGIGWGNFSRFAPFISLDQDSKDNLYAHNILLEFWIEAGLVAALAFVSFLILILTGALRSATRSPQSFALAALTVDLLTGAMLSSDVIGNRMLWVVLAAVLATSLPGRPARRPFVPPDLRREGTRRRVRSR